MDETVQTIESDNGSVEEKSLINDITKEKSEEIIQHAKKKGYEISQKIVNKSTRIKLKLKNKKQSLKTKAIKKLTTSKSDYLDLLEKLGNLKKAGIITSKEFEEKKKKILSRI